MSKATFSDMLVALEAQIRSFGRPTKLSRADQFLLTPICWHWREYRTQFHIAQSYGASEASVCRTVVKIENALARSGQFRFPGKKALRGEGCSIEAVLVDTTEQSIERPKKDKQRTHYSGKKKRHTQKAQLAIDASAKRLAATAFGSGAMHDFCFVQTKRTSFAA